MNKKTVGTGSMPQELGGERWKRNGAMVGKRLMCQVSIFFRMVRIVAYVNAEAKKSEERGWLCGGDEG